MGEGDRDGGGGRGRVLVATDDLFGRKVVARLLERLGWGVDLSPSGGEAVGPTHATTYDSVILELRLEDAEAWARSSRLLEARGGSEKPRIVALLSDEPGASVAACRAAGVDAWIPKPVSLDSLRKALTAPRVLDGSRLERLAELGEPGLVTELLDHFAADAPGRLESLRSAAAGANLAEAQRAAHSFKGASASLGAEALAEVCARMEAVSGIREVQVLLPRLEHELQRAGEALTAYRGEISSSRPGEGS